MKTILKRKHLKLLAITIFVTCLILVVSQTIPFTSEQIRHSNQQIFTTTQALSKQEIFDRITSNSWGCQDTKIPMTPGPDYYKYTFNADGTYRIDHITDFIDSPRQGKWNFNQQADGYWYLIFDSGQRNRFAFNNNKLILDYQELSACSQTLPTNNTYTADNLPSIQLPESLKKQSDILTAQSWKRANDTNLDYEPTSIEFKNDWQYITTWQNGQCQNSGAWSLTEKVISGSSLTDNCDTRNDNYPENYHAELYDSRHLILEDNLYIPSNVPLTKAIIWNASTYADEIQIQIEYDIPIKVQQTNQLIIRVTNNQTNKSYTNLKLERFYLTRDYIRNYRELDQNKMDEIELAGIDLKSTIIKPGQTSDFSIPVTFLESGKQIIYFNLLTSGPTQNWDSHKNYQLNIQ